MCCSTSSSICARPAMLPSQFLTASRLETRDSMTPTECLRYLPILPQNCQQTALKYRCLSRNNAPASHSLEPASTPKRGEPEDHGAAEKRSKALTPEARVELLETKFRWDTDT